MEPKCKIKIQIRIDSQWFSRLSWSAACSLSLTGDGKKGYVVPMKEMIWASIRFEISFPFRKNIYIFIESHPLVPSNGWSTKLSISDLTLQTLCSGFWLNNIEIVQECLDLIKGKEKKKPALNLPCILPTDN